MSIERDLISKIIRDGDIAAVSDAGVNTAFFKKAEHREAFKYILEHQRNHSKAPSQEAFLRNYPTYRISDPQEPMGYYTDEISRDHKAWLIEDGLVKATDLFDEGFMEEAEAEILRMMKQVNQEITRVRATDLTETGPDRIERYKTYSLNQGALKGVSTGFDMLDWATGGMQPGQLHTFVGPPKAGKSTMLLLSMILAHQAFYRPLFLGFEMSNQEQEERHDAIRAGISHKRLRDGTLTKEEMQKLERMTRRLEQMPPLIFTADATSTSTLSGVAALIEKHQPNVVYIDGMYMMDDEEGEAKNSPQALTNLTRGLKRMAQNTNLPFAISTQVLHSKMDRKRGVTTSSIGYSSSFGQDSDVLYGVEPTDEDDVNKVKILDGRNVKRMEMYTRWDWETGKFEELDDDEEGEVAPEEETRF